MSKYHMMQIGFPRFRVVKDKQTGFYKCHLCSYKSVYGSSLRSHFAVHSNARPYGCDMCSYEAKRLPDLKKHKILKHIRKGQAGLNQAGNKSPLQVFRDPGSGLYRCQHCSYQSDNARCVRSHLAVHSHLRPYACDVCSYEAKRSSDLSKHKIIKHGRVPCRRNKPRVQTEPRPEKLPPVPEFSGVNPGMASNVAVASPGMKQHGMSTELDHTDVLSDLDYSLMTPTRAAFEALRRCNMEPLDMFNEYSHHDSFQHNPVFPEPETDFSRRSENEYHRRPEQDFNRRPPSYHQPDVNLSPANTRPEEPKGNYVYTNIPGNYVNVQRPVNEQTVFIKPEPPDDYFDHMNCQMQDQNLNNTANVCHKSKQPNSGDERAKQQTSNEPAINDDKDRTTKHAEDRRDSIQESVGSTSDQQTTPTQSYSEMVSTSVPSSSPCTTDVRSHSEPPDSMCEDASLMHLERRNLSGSSLITRPFQPSAPACRAVECERASADCSQSRESGYSSPGSASLSTQNQQMTGHADLVDLDLRQENLSKVTNTRKSWSCVHCDIMFFDGAMYFMHMGLHNINDPWRCNMCATKFYDVYGFTSHFVNGHS